ncbi:MAG TPA: CapA family protein [Bacteroidales bacterium]|mgnify:CR=1 FL=1|nr:CapA family protein [Bacteroidales bacterium]
MKLFFKCFFLLSFIVFPGRLTFAQQDTISVVAVGDIMPGTNFPSDKYLPADSGKNIFKPVTHILENADLAIGNLEGCLLNTGGTVKKCQDSTKCYAFRIPTCFSKIMKEAGFDLLNLANNHCGDFGEAGRESTKASLDSAGIYYTGLNSAPTVILEKNGLKIGCCSFSPFTGTVDILKTDTIKKIVKTLDSLCDIVIVSMHAGAEGAKYAHVTKQTEIFYDEDRGNVYEFAHLVIDNGADLVVGHGPHITRAVELYKDRFIAYSLGNFCTYGRFNLNGPNGVAPVIEVFLSNSGEFLKAEVFSIKQTGEGGPIMDPDNNALKQLIELTRSDFPETRLLIDETGGIKKSP